MPEAATEDVTAEVTDLLQHLIRNACVNDGTISSGQEERSAEMLAALLSGAGLDVQRYEPHPGRTSLVARLAGRRKGAPSLLLMGHTDVVPANAEHWRRDPFGGELVEGEVWGRGAVDMLNLTSSMAVAVAQLARRGFAPEGDLVYAAVADEEALGTHGAQWLVEHARDDVLADYVITESGGIPMATGGGLGLPLMVAEKGSYWCTLRVRGTPGHASQPLRTDNAVVKAAAVVHRLATHRGDPHLHQTWRDFVVGLDLPAEFARVLLDPASLEDFCAQSDQLGLARMAHACTHTTFAPTVIRGGSKTNVIPDSTDIQVDIRTLPGESEATVRAQLDTILGDLAADVEVIAASDDPATASPTETPLVDAIRAVCGRFYPGSKIVPTLMVGATDARFFRRKGVPSYGFGLFSQAMSFEQYATMFHGDDERVDMESLRLSTEMWMALAHDFLGPAGGGADR